MARSRPLPDSRMALLLVAGIWLGAACFFSFVVAPAAFRLLPRPEAGRFVSAVFPVYHALGMICAVAGLALLLREGRTAPVIAARWWSHGAWMTLQVAGLALLLLVRAIRVEREAHPSPELDARFSAMHGASMIVNLLALLSALATLLLALR